MIRNFNNYILNEMSINDDSIRKYKNALQNIFDYKKTSSYINELILNLKNSISINGFNIKKYSEDDTYLIYKIKYAPSTNFIIEQLEDLLYESRNLDVYYKYFSLIYPDGNELSFNIEIEIEKNNLNRIYVPNGLPYILKGIGIGRKLYKLLIYELNYISSNYLDRSLESLYVWDSIRKDNEIFTFINGESIIGISPKLQFEKTEEILSIFYNNITNQYIILDDDFKNQYNREILKSKKLSMFLTYEINQTSN
ncbi:hypothetical protein M0Q97_02635 [Candidatus Dojkabacteria bacterium]|jgi:hypothetical protein|nr:hypothetical protein [Candidatus Dojkabacteria bacterium]